MLKSPFSYESKISASEFQKIGEIMLRCSHIEHILGNCLRVMLRLTEEGALFVVFPLSLEQRYQNILRSAKISDLNAEAQAALAEVSWAVRDIQIIRNDLAHAIINETEDEIEFHNRAKTRNISKSDFFSAEELVNYVAHAALALRLALGLKGDSEARHTLPERPNLPAFLAKRR